MLIRTLALAGAAAFALSADPALAGVPFADPDAVEAHVEEDIDLDIDLGEDGDDQIEAMAEDFAIVMQTMAARIATVRMNPDLAQADKEAQAAAIQAEYQPEMDAFTAAIVGVVGAQVTAAGGSAEEAQAQAALIGQIVSAAVMASSLGGMDAATEAEIEAAALALEAMEMDEGEE